MVKHEMDAVSGEEDNLGDGASSVPVEVDKTMPEIE